MWYRFFFRYHTNLETAEHIPCAFTMSVFDAAVAKGMVKEGASTAVKQEKSDEDDETAAPSLDDSKRLVKQKIKDTNKSSEHQNEKFKTKQIGTIRDHFSSYSDLRDKETMKDASSLAEHIMGNDVVFEEALVQLSDMSVRLVDFFANMTAEPEHLQEQMTHNAWKQLQKVTSK